MNRTTIAAVKADAERVLALCAEAKNELSHQDSEAYIGGTKTSGALRRASMDLTRSLARMRKP